MDALLWQRLHGGSTHFPIVLLLVSVGFDAVAWRSRDDGLRRGLHAAGLAAAVVGVAGGSAAVITGLFLSNGQWVGSGLERIHHLFVWPAFALCLGLVLVRVFRRGRVSPRGFRFYLSGMSLASALMMGAGYWGGEMLLGAKGKPGTAASLMLDKQAPALARGHDLFLMNCAHCHGDDARGTDEGADLTRLRKSDARIASLVTNGIKGQMPRFGAKLHDEDVRQLIQFLHSVNTI
jgi:mono/diheme cytochrome c family protein